MNAIVDGDYPCPLKQAVHFAAIKMQVDFGDYDPNDAKTIKYVLCRKLFLNFYSKDLVLPPEWRKEKNVETQIVAAWKNLVRMNPQQAKYRYYQQMRNLRSFGMQCVHPSSDY